MRSQTSKFILNIITIMSQFTLPSCLYETCLYSMLIQKNKRRWQNNKIYSEMTIRGVDRGKEIVTKYLGKNQVIY